MDLREKKAKNEEAKKQKNLKKQKKQQTSVRKNVSREVPEKVRRKIETYPPNYILDKRKKKEKITENEKAGKKKCT